MDEKLRMNVRSMPCVDSYDFSVCCQIINNLLDILNTLPLPVSWLICMELIKIYDVLCIMEMYAVRTCTLRGIAIISLILIYYFYFDIIIQWGFSVDNPTRIRVKSQDSENTYRRLIKLPQKGSSH